MTSCDICLENEAEHHLCDACQHDAEALFEDERILAVREKCAQIVESMIDNSYVRERVAAAIRGKEPSEDSNE